MPRQWLRIMGGDDPPGEGDVGKVLAVGVGAGVRQG